LTTYTNACIVTQPAAATSHDIFLCTRYIWNIDKTTETKMVKESPVYDPHQKQNQTDRYMVNKQPL